MCIIEVAVVQYLVEERPVDGVTDVIIIRPHSSSVYFFSWLIAVFTADVHWQAFLP